MFENLKMMLPVKWQLSLAAPAQNEPAELSRKQKALLTAVAVVSTIFAFALLWFFLRENVFAENDLFTQAGTTFKEIYTGLGTVITAVGLVAIAICAFKWVMGSDPQTVKSAKTWMLNIIIGLVIYWVAYLIINTVGDMTDDIDNNDAINY